MDKLERLLNLTAALLGTSRPLSAAELRARIPGYPDNDSAFRRAFERDKDALRQMGVPLMLTEVPFADPPVEGYRIAKEDYYLRDPGLEAEELAALHLAAAAVRVDAGPGLEALWKLEGLVEGVDDLVAPDASIPAFAELPQDPNLGPLFSAAVDRRTVEFEYRGTTRRVDPYRLEFHRGRWYLTGLDHVRDEPRNYRVDRIQGEVTSGPAGAFERPAPAAGGPAEPWQFREDEPVAARLLVDRDHAAWVRRHLDGTAAFTDQADGSVVVEVEVSNWPAFRSFVLTFLDHAEILEPARLRDDLVAWLEAIERGIEPAERVGRGEADRART